MNKSICKIIASVFLLILLGYSNWTEWSENCTKPCGVGKQYRNRTCYYNDTSFCTLNDVDEKDCNVHDCPGRFFLADNMVTKFTNVYEYAHQQTFINCASCVYSP